MEKDKITKILKRGRFAIAMGDIEKELPFYELEAGDIIYDYPISGNDRDYIEYLVLARCGMLIMVVDLETFNSQDILSCDTEDWETIEDLLNRMPMASLSKKTIIPDKPRTKREIFEKIEEILDGITFLDKDVAQKILKNEFQELWIMDKLETSGTNHVGDSTVYLKNN